MFAIAFSLFLHRVTKYRIICFADISSGFELVKKNQFTKIYKHNKENGPLKNFFGFVNHFMKNVKGSNPVSTNITKWSNTPQQIADKLSVFDHFARLVLNGLTKFCKLIWLSFAN